MGRAVNGEVISRGNNDIRAYDGVRTKRVVACMIDYAIVGLLMIPFGVLVLVVGLLTLGLGWTLFSILVPLVVAIYVWNTLGGSGQATIGMKIMGIRLHRLDGRRIDGLTALVHTALFWAANVLLTPAVLLVTVFSDRKRTLHDLLLGTVVMCDDR